MAKVLILGGGGFIGYHLANRLALDSGNQITLVDDFSRHRLDTYLKEFLARTPNLRLTAGDLRDAGLLASIGGPFDQVYLLAGIVGVRNVESDAARVLHTNITIILNTLEWLKDRGCGRLFFASTSEAYSGSVDLGLAEIPTPEQVPLAVTDIQHPRSTYALSKMVGEAAVTHYALSAGFEAVSARYHNVYGPRMGVDHVIPELMQRIHQRIDPMPVYSVEQTRAFCYVSDAVEATIALMNCELNGPVIVHVGNDTDEITIGNLLDRLLSITGFQPEISPLPAPAASVARRCPDISMLRSLTGFDPAVGIDDGLKLTWEWYKDRFFNEATEAGAVASN